MDWGVRTWGEGTGEEESGKSNLEYKINEKFNLKYLFYLQPCDVSFSAFSLVHVHMHAGI